MKQSVEALHQNYSFHVFTQPRPKDVFDPSGLIGWLVSDDRRSSRQKRNHISLVTGKYTSRGQVFGYSLNTALIHWAFRKIKNRNNDRAEYIQLAWYSNAVVAIAPAH